MFHSKSDVLFFAVCILYFFFVVYQNRLIVLIAIMLECLLLLLLFCFIFMLIHLQSDQPLIRLFSHPNTHFYSILLRRFMLSSVYHEWMKPAATFINIVHAEWMSNKTLNDYVFIIYFWFYMVASITNRVRRHPICSKMVCWWCRHIFFVIIIILVVVVVVSRL